MEQLLFAGIWYNNYKAIFPTYVGVIPRRCYYGFVRRKSWWALASTLLCSIWAEVFFLPNHSGRLSSTRHCRWTSLSFRYSTCAVSSIRNLIETVRHELCSMPASTFSFFLLKTNIWEIDHFSHFSHLFSLSYLKTILLRTNKKVPKPCIIPYQCQPC